MENNTDEKHGQNISDSHTLFLEILDSFKKKKYQDVMQLVNQYKAHYPTTPEIKKIAERTVERITAEKFIQKCLTDIKKYVSEKDYTKAAQECRKIKGIDPQNPEVRVLEQELANLKHEQEEKAQRPAETEGIDPALGSEELLEEALIFYYQQNWLEAQHRFQRILDINPQHLKAQTFLDECHNNLQAQETSPPENAEVSDILQPIVGNYQSDPLEGDPKLAQEREPETGTPNARAPVSKFTTISDLGLDGPADLTGEQFTSQKAEGIPPLKVRPRVIVKETSSINIFTIILFLLCLFVVVIFGWTLYHKYEQSARQKMNQ
ncbi:tetratricopeptide repeat protein, partial [candidate division CSSED10-310 bacterium]